MKKFMLISLALACLLTMCSCGSTPDTLDADTKATTTTTEGQTTTTTATDEVKKPEPLDADTEAKIKADYAATASARSINPVTVDDVVIDYYYGIYQGDAVALYITAKEGYLTSIVEETIAGYDFWFGSSQPLYIYHESEFTPLKEAYEAGLVSKDDVKDIYEQRGNR